MITRRAAIGGGMALGIGLLGIRCVAATAPQPGGPEEYGARGDGVTDDTDALQRWIDAAGEGATLTLRRNAVYRVNTAARPSYYNYGGLQLRRGQTLRLEGAELRALASAHVEGCVIQGDRVDNWRIIGPGRIVGERAIHAGSGGEWGMGIAAWSATGWRIEDVEIVDCWGDGILVSYAPTAPGTYCTHFAIERVQIRGCRRNGISVIAGQDGAITDTVIRAIAGTSPSAGIDLEPDNGRHPNARIAIHGVDIAECMLGIAVTVGNDKVGITASSIEGDNSGVMIGDGTRDLTIADNSRIRSSLGNREGGAIRSAAGNNTTIERVAIHGNTLGGGGFFVIDFAAGAQGVAVTGNRIVADNPGSRIARLFTGSRFERNDCEVASNGGVKGGYIVQLVGTSQADNSYRNRSPFDMPPLR